MNEQTTGKKKKVIKFTEIVKHCLVCGEKIRDDNWCSKCEEFVKERNTYPSE